MKEKNKWDQPDLDIVLFKTLRRQKLLAEEDLPRNFDLREEKVYPYFKENKYGVFDWGLPGANADLFDNFNW